MEHQDQNMQEKHDEEIREEPQPNQEDDKKSGELDQEV
jgi:hypothetical protein